MLTRFSVTNFQQIRRIIKWCSTNLYLALLEKYGNNVSDITENVAKKENCKIQHVQVLFDKDNFKPDNFNNAIAKVKCLTNSTTTYHALWSNQCFELWLLLNFINMQSAINKEAYIEKLEVYLKEKYKK